MEAQDVVHRVTAGGLVREPEGGPNCALGEDGPAFGAVAELDPFAVAGEDYLMVADHRPAAQRREADMAGLSLAHAVAAALGDGAYVNAAPFRRGPAQTQPPWYGSSPCR